MKIGKYPVKHSYKIPRIIADVFSVGLAVFICSVEIMFMTVYDDTLKTYIGGEALEKLMQADSSLGWKHWLTLIFPAAVLAVFAVYIVLVLKSHRLKGFNVTKRNAQKLYDMYALCASLCKIPALMFISEMMMITHNNMLMADEGWFTLQLVLDRSAVRDGRRRSSVCYSEPGRSQRRQHCRVGSCGEHKRRYVRLPHDRGQRIFSLL